MGAGGVNILLVEDNPDQALVMQRALTRYQSQWDITVVTNGASCLERLSSATYPIVILDYSLPGMDGLEVLRRITESYPLSSVIMVTGRGDEQIAVNAMKGGAVDYLVKGEHYLVNLPAVVDRAIEQDRLKRALAESQRRLSELSQVSLDLSMASDLDRATQILADGARLLTRSGVALTVLLDPATILVERVATSRLTIHESLVQTSLQNRGILGVLLTSPAPVVFNDLPQQPNRDTMPAHSPLIETALVLPIMHQQDVAGIVLVGNPESGLPYHSDQMEALLNLSLHAASVMKNLRSVEEARRQAVTDGLTGLFNHRECQKRLAEELERAQRYGRTFSVLLVDVDHFKSVNDACGHQVGDRVLKQVAQRTTQHLRQVDIAARYGGEEFMVILPETAGEAAMLVADRIRQAVMSEGVDTPSGDKLLLTVSVGVATFPEDADTREGLIASADHALYVAKEMGRNQVCRYSRATQPSVVHEPEAVSALLGDPTLKAVRDLAAAVDAKSAYTRGHSFEVTRFAVQFANHLGLTDDQKEGLQIAGLLHNLGVVSVPDRILAKPGPLTEEERKIIQAHPGLADLLGREAPRFKAVAQAILYHHERWDGHGYPCGLNGEEIPRLARILGLVEAYHAMLSARPYRRRLTPDEAILELRAGAGSQFDPYLVERFIEILGKNRGAPPSAQEKDAA
jgi:diguanylate cyclase (GGDEF)-like protein